MSSAKILIVEDEGIVALDLQNRLNQLGYHTVGRATTGKDAISLALTLEPDLVLMDIQIQGDVDGIETARRIHEHRNIPIIYLTAYANEQTIQRAKTTEPYGYLIKPFEERELYTTVEIALYKSCAERKIEEQAQQLNRILYSVPEGVILLDADRQILQANAIAVEHLTCLADANNSVSLDYLGGYNLSELLQTGAPSWHKEVEVITEAVTRIFDVTIERVSNTEHSSYGTGASGWVIVTRDTTESQQIRQRAQQQEQMAAIGHLAAGIAHDFNNILAAINMATEMVQITQRDLTPDNHKRLGIVMQQSERASALIKQIMDFSRRSVSEHQHINLVTLIKELRTILDHTFPETITIDFSQALEECMIDADPTQMLQVLMNLSVNARDAMTNGGHMAISIEQRKFDEGDVPVPGMKPGSWAVIKVTDSGTGIPSDVLPHIFEPFFSTKSPDQGTGLGLAQVYGIIQKHEGYIDVTTSLGKGTTFMICLPALSETSSNPNESSTGHAQVQPGVMQQILLVEDNDVLRGTVVEVLKMSNYDVLEASNGVEALEILRSSHNHVKLVISDLIMPKMGGSELCQEVISEYPDVAIVMMTGYSPQEEILKLKSAGVVNWLQKPIKVQNLCDCIAKALQPAL